MYWHEDRGPGGGHWAITRHEDLDFISKHPEIFSSAERTCFLLEPTEDRLELLRLQMINMDPPQHLKFRRLVRNAFTPRIVESYEPRFREIAREIVEKAVQGGECEFVEDIATELPLVAICELMGVPLDWRRRLFELTNVMLGLDDPELAATADAGPQLLPRD